MAVSRVIRAGVRQGGPALAPVDTSVIDVLEGEQLQGLDLLVLSELALSPYVAVAETHHPESAIAVDGPEIQRICAIAAQHQVYIVVPFMERGESPGLYYNSVAMVGPEGLIEAEVISGPSRGARQSTYRKVHLSENHSSNPGVHEKYHFRSGDGFVLWRTPLGVVAPLICYDRSFPESWRTVASAGADIVVVPIATSRPERVHMLAMELQVAAMQSGVFVLAACKAGEEDLDGSTVKYSGGSLVVEPGGAVLAGAGPEAVAEVVVTDLDPARLSDYSRVFHYSRDRRPDAYCIQFQADVETTTEEIL